MTGPLGRFLPPFSATNTKPGATSGSAGCVTVRCGGVIPLSEREAAFAGGSAVLVLPELHAARARTAKRTKGARTAGDAKALERPRAWERMARLAPPAGRARA